jgi:zinc transport system ATP-binding protein
VVTTVLEVNGLSVAFGANPIIENLSFRVARGASLAVIGPNGSGKTVLFKALIGSVPFRGTVEWATGTRLGYVPQKLDLGRDLPVTGLDLLHARAALANTPTANVQQALDLVGVTREVAETPIGALSGGQFQRILMAFALIGDPNVLLLDEPTAGVDEPGQARLNELLRSLRQDRQMTVLFISHELSVVYEHATDVLCLGRRQACIGPPRTILTPELLESVYGSPVSYHVHG